MNELVQRMWMRCESDTTIYDNDNTGNISHTIIFVKIKCLERFRTN